MEYPYEKISVVYNNKTKAYPIQYEHYNGNKKYLLMSREVSGPVELYTSKFSIPRSMPQMTVPTGGGGSFGFGMSGNAEHIFTVIGNE